MTLKIWVTIKPMTVDRGGSKILLPPGEQIPEAEDWPNADVWIARGYIKPLDIEVPLEFAERLLEKATAPQSNKHRRKAG